MIRISITRLKPVAASLRGYHRLRSMIRISITRLKRGGELLSLVQSGYPINDKNLDYEIETGTGSTD